MITVTAPDHRPAQWRQRLPWYAATLAVAATIVALVLATSGDTPTPPTPPTATAAGQTYQPIPGVQLTGPPAGTTPSAPESPTVADPYDVWQAIKPADAPDLSPDDAFARALLGCGVQWPPGSTDHALQVAYANTGRIRCP